MNEMDNLFADPVEEDLQIVRSRALAAVCHQPKLTPNFWFLCGLTALAVTLACLAWFVPEQAKTPNRELHRPEAEQSTSLPTPAFPERQLQPRLHYVRRERRRKMQIGLQSAEWVTAPDGSSQVRMQTADPTVIILLQVNSSRKEN